MDYTSLASTIASRLNRSDLTSVIPDFITRAEDEIFARLSADPLRPMAAIFGYSSSPNQTRTLPSDFIDVIDLYASDGTDTWQLVRLGVSEPASFYSTRSLPYATEYDSTKLRHYWIIGTDLILSDTPSSSLSLTLRYYRKPAAISSGNLTNWVINSHADVYEFGSLMHAARHIRDDELEDRMADRFATAMGLMADAYPESQNAAELRASDAPWAALRWNINSD